MGKACKRPAAAPAAAASAPKKLKNVRWATEVNMVSPSETVLKLLQAAGVRRSAKNEPLRWGSAFDGLNMPAWTLQMLNVPTVQHFGAEIADAPAFFGLRNFRMAHGHLFQDLDCHCTALTYSIHNVNYCSCFCNC